MQKKENCIDGKLWKMYIMTKYYMLYKNTCVYSVEVEQCALNAES